jgi:uncharacterized protein YfdQ (DUF2303 family)
MAEITEVEALARLAASGRMVAPSYVGGSGKPFTIDGNGNVVDLEPYLAEPLRIAEDRMFTSVESFTTYVNRFKGENTAIFADQKGDQLIAEIDSHGPGKPSRVTHIATLKLEKTLAMAAWMKANNIKMRQADFADFIEDNATDISDPAAAVMIEVAHHMKATKDAQFESKVNLENGSFVFKHNEEVKGTRKDGTTEVPAGFKLALTVYRGQTQPFSLDAKLRYRIDDGSLIMWFVVPLLARLLEQAFDDVVTQVKKATGIDILHGG